jgi:hypothetical protein
MHIIKLLSCTSSSEFESVKDDAGATDLFRKENVAIALGYFSVGFVGSFLATPLNVYLVEYLNVEPDVQNTISILQSLPVRSLFVLIRHFIVII